jgi:PAS domain-containing protein
MNAAAPRKLGAEPSRAELVELIRAAQCQQTMLEAELLAAREQVRELQALHEHTVELSDQLVWAADAKGRIVSLGLRVYERLQPDPQLPPHEAWLSLLHPDDLPDMKRVWAQARATGERYTAEFRMRRPDGGYGIFLARAAPISTSRAASLGGTGWLRTLPRRAARKLRVARPNSACAKARSGIATASS